MRPNIRKRARLGYMAHPPHPPIFAMSVIRSDHAVMTTTIAGEMSDLIKLTALRYVQPLREGGSLPAVVETDDGRYVVKFRGAGQGPKALVAELVVGLLARELELPVPDLALVEVAPIFGRSEPDPEIQDLLRASHGLNVGIRYLDGAFNFALAAAGDLIHPEFAARLVWLDAFVTNPDRTHRNPNLLVWKRTPWLIDHGAALYAHHDWERVDRERTRTPFPLIKDHVLLSASGDLESADGWCATRVTEERIRQLLALVPDDLLAPDAELARIARERYAAYLVERLRAPRVFVGEAVTARERLVSRPNQPLQIRR